MTVGRQKTRLRGSCHTNPRYPTRPKDIHLENLEREVRTAPESRPSQECVRARPAQREPLPLANLHARAPPRDCGKSAVHGVLAAPDAGRGQTFGPLVARQHLDAVVFAVVAPSEWSKKSRLGLAHGKDRCVVCRVVLEQMSSLFLLFWHPKEVPHTRRS